MVGFGVAMFFLGFLLGTYRRRLRAALAAALLAATGMSKTSRAGNDGEGSMTDSDTDDGDEVESEEQVLEHFLSSVSDPGIDDHAELFFNPIVEYHMKRTEKEELRKRSDARMRRVLEEEGTPPDEIERIMAGRSSTAGNEGSSMNAVTSDWMSAWAVLIRYGAAIGQSTRSANRQADEAELQREKLIEVNKHLVRTGVSTKWEAQPHATLVGAQPSALDVALHDALNPTGGATRAKQAAYTRIEYAKRGRTRVAPPHFSPRNREPVSWRSVLANARRLRRKALGEVDEADDEAESPPPSFRRNFVMGASGPPSHRGFDGPPSHRGLDGPPSHRGFDGPPSYRSWAATTSPNLLFACLKQPANAAVAPAARNPANDAEEMRQLFEMFDADGSGSVSHEELFIALGKMGHEPTKRVVDFLMRDVDLDAHGGIGFAQFAALVKREKAVEGREQKEFDMINDVAEKSRMMRKSAFRRSSAAPSILPTLNTGDATRQMRVQSAQSDRSSTRVADDGGPLSWRNAQESWRAAQEGIRGAMEQAGSTVSKALGALTGNGEIGTCEQLSGGQRQPPHGLTCAPTSNTSSPASTSRSGDLRASRLSRLSGSQRLQEWARPLETLHE